MQWIKLFLLLILVSVWASNSESQTSGGGPFTNHPAQIITYNGGSNCFPYEVNYTTTSGSVYSCIGGVATLPIGSGGGGGSPGGSNTQVQYNNSGSFGGISGVTTGGTALTIASGDLKLAGSSTGATTLNSGLSSTSNNTLTLPTATTTLAGLAVAQTFTANQTISATLAATIEKPGTLYYGGSTSILSSSTEPLYWTVGDKMEDSNSNFYFDNYGPGDVYDSTGSHGSSGQVLTSNGGGTTGVSWAGITAAGVVTSLSTVTAGATPTITAVNNTIYSITGMSTAITSMTTNFTAPAHRGDIIEILFEDSGSPEGITWGSDFISTTVTLPITTVASTLLHVFLQYDGSYMECIGVA